MIRAMPEEGMSGEHANVCLYGENPTLDYADDTVAPYKLRYHLGGKGLLYVVQCRLFETPYRSPQAWELGETGRLKVLRVPEYTPSRQWTAGCSQLTPLAESGALG